MTVLTRDAILAAEDIAVERIEVPEWGGTVAVRAMTGADRDDLEAAVVAGGRPADSRNFRAKVVALSIVDEEGGRLFTLEDVEALGRKSAKALDRVFQVAMRLSALSDRGQEELRGNSSGAESAVSSSS